MKAKKISIALLTLTALSCAACEPGSGGGENAGGKESYDITVWVSESAGVTDLTQTQISRFAEENDVTINATLEGVTEADQATKMLTDVEAGADIFCFAQDQFARLVEGGALSQLGVAAQTEVIEANDAGTVAAAKSGEAMYAYPLTSDNGYFMYYDKRYIDESHIGSLESIIADCESAGKNFSMEITTSAWYTAAFFFAVREGSTEPLCKSNWTTDENGKFISVDDTFNSANGLIAAKGISKLTSSTSFNSSSNAADFSAGVASAVVVSGTWAYETAKTALGENLGVAALPSFEVEGVKYHLGSYSGCKLMGVKPCSDVKRSAMLHKLARYLTNYECQMERFNNFSWGPSNKLAQEDENVKANPALSALIAQSPYSIPQGQIHGSWWDIGKALGVAIQEAANDETKLQKALSDYEDTIKALFSLSGYILVGAWNSWSNSDTTLKLVQQDDTHYGIIATVSADDAGRIVTAGEWGTDYNYNSVIVGRDLVEDDGGGDGNFKFKEGGSYLFTIYTVEKTVTIEKAQFILVGAWNNWNNNDISVALKYTDGKYETTITVEQSDFMGGRPVNLSAWDGYDATAHQIVSGSDLVYIQDTGDHNIMFERPGTYKVSLDATTLDISVSEVVE